MLMILMTAIPTMALYVIVMRQVFVGLLQMLSMFIIMGIGADDIFVLLDCYEADRDFNFGPDRRPLKYDLSAAWRHAAKATLCTSITTFFSFLSNSRSPFPAIYTFGFWCCALIVVNFFSVHTFYLSVLSIYDKYFCHKRICCIGNLNSTAAVAPEGTTEVDVSAKTEQTGAGESGEGGGEDEEFKGMALVFSDKIYPLILRFRYPIVGLWIVLFIVYGVSASFLEPDPDAPAILPDSDPYGQWNSQLIKHFGALDNPYRMEVVLSNGSCAGVGY